MRFIYLTFLITFYLQSLAQGTSAENWKVLSKLEYEKSKDEYGEIYVPKFSPEIRALENHVIELSGYIIPFEGMFAPEHLIISAVPISSCFFCGGAGPESVAEIYLKAPVKYTAKKVTLRGKLSLNSSDVDQLMYILKDAQMVVN